MKFESKQKEGRNMFIPKQKLITAGLAILCAGILVWFNVQCASAQAPVKLKAAGAFLRPRDRR
jgi:hypothetical protein